MPSLVLANMDGYRLTQVLAKLAGVHRPAHKACVAVAALASGEAGGLVVCAQRRLLLRALPVSRAKGICNESAGEIVGMPDLAPGPGAGAAGRSKALRACRTLNQCVAMHVAARPEEKAFTWVGRKGEDKRQLTWRQLDTALSGTAEKLRSAAHLRFGDTGKHAVIASRARCLLPLAA